MQWQYCDYVFPTEDVELSVEAGSGSIYALNEESDWMWVLRHDNQWRCYHEALGGMVGNKKYCDYHFKMHDSRD